MPASLLTTASSWYQIKDEFKYQLKLKGWVYLVFTFFFRFLVWSHEKLQGSDHDLRKEEYQVNIIH